ncbi:hypothetical protein Tco_0649518 [Tanacetum coccineum]
MVETTYPSQFSKVVQTVLKEEGLARVLIRFRNKIEAPLDLLNRNIVLDLYGFSMIRAMLQQVYDCFIIRTTGFSNGRSNSFHLPPGVLRSSDKKKVLPGDTYVWSPELFLDTGSDDSKQKWTSWIDGHQWDHHLSRTPEQLNLILIGKIQIVDQLREEFIPN